jgi:hypothetical protein
MDWHCHFAYQFISVLIICFLFVGRRLRHETWLLFVTPVRSFPTVAPFHHSAVANSAVFTPVPGPAFASWNRLILVSALPSIMKVSLFPSFSTMVLSRLMPARVLARRLNRVVQVTNGGVDLGALDGVLGEPAYLGQLDEALMRMLPLECVSELDHAVASYRRLGRFLLLGCNIEPTAGRGIAGGQPDPRDQ